MSVEPLIEELTRRGLVSSRLAEKLRDRVANSDRPLSIKAVAKFLVQKNHVSQAHAKEALAALAARGIDIDAVPSAGADRAAPEIGPALDGGVTVISPGPGRRRDDLVIDEPESPDEGEGAESSSIFAPFLTEPRKKPSREPRTPQNDSNEDDANQVDSDRDDSAQDAALEPATPLSPREVKSVDDLRELKASGSSPEQDAPLMADPVLSDANLRAGPSPLRPGSSARLAGFKAERARAEKLAARRIAASERGREKRRASKKKPKQTNEWDSPLILLGGGALALLVLGGATIAFMLSRETGDERLATAHEAVQAGSYSQAIENYEDFLEDFPRHPERSRARVQLAMARIRKGTEAGNFSLALADAESELAAIQDEERFNEAHDELAALLPRIALGLAGQAERAADRPDEGGKLIEQSTAALALASNSRYVPSSLRDDAELAEVRDVLDRVGRRQQSQSDLQQALGTIFSAIESGETTAAYGVHRSIIKLHPELLTNEELDAAVRRVSAAEAAQIRFVQEEQAAETSERPRPWVATLTLAHRRRAAPTTNAVDSGTAAASGIVCVRADGALYGLEVNTGRLLWRRAVGFSERGWPTMIGGDVLVSDDQHHELIRLEAATGRLRWRQEIGDEFAMPLIAGERAYVAATSGRLHIVDLSSGTRLGYVQFPQPLSVSPTVDRNQRQLYLTGEQFSLYAISLADLQCLGVYYLGHAKGSVRVAPARVLDRLAVLENDGVETSRLHLLSLDERAAPASLLTERRLAGMASSPMIVAGRRLIVATDRGQIDVYDVSAKEGDESLTLVATRTAPDRQPLVRHVGAVEGHIWVADTRLTKHAVLPTGNRLPVESIDDSFTGSAFDHPLQFFGSTLVHLRRPQGRAGVAVAAMEVDGGRTIWETDLAMPLASSPVVDSSGRGFAVASAAGQVFRFDEAAIRAGVQDQPVVARGMPATVPRLSEGVALAAGRAAFYASGKSDRLLLYDPAQNGEARWVQLPATLACPVTPLADGVIAPLAVGQVFYLDSQTGQRLAAPYQPRLEPGTIVEYRSAAVVNEAERQFVITDGRQKIYLLAVGDGPQAAIGLVAEASIGPYEIVSPLFVLGDLAVAVAGESHLVGFQLPSLESAGDVNLASKVVWGPFKIGDQLLLATADNKLRSITSAGEVAWTEQLERSDLAGPPLGVEGGVLIAYRNGQLERRGLADGKPNASVDVGHPIAAGPVRFLQRVVLTGHDGTLFVVDQP